jgi:hypothetical protein
VEIGAGDKPKPADRHAMCLAVSGASIQTFMHFREVAIQQSARFVMEERV